MVRKNARTSLASLLRFTAAACLLAIQPLAPAAAATSWAPLPDAGGVTAGAPEIAAWTDLLSRYYNPARGMNYRALKDRDTKTLVELRRRMAEVDPARISRNDQLAYWINLYNISVVGIVVDHYPVASIRDISTDPITRLNVFKKDSVTVKGGAISLNDLENEKIRAAFKDSRIHFAINCAAVSCPPIRAEAFAGSRIDEQLDDQARRFLNDSRLGVRIDSADGLAIIHVTKIMDWFGDDFKKWAGGEVAFIRRYLTPDKQEQLDAAKGNVKLEFYSYDWKLNDAAGKS